MGNVPFRVLLISHNSARLIYLPRKFHWFRFRVVLVPRSKSCAMSRSGMKRRNVENGLTENLTKPATDPSNTNGQSVAKRGRTNKKAVEDAILASSAKNGKTVKLPANQTNEVEEQEIKKSQVATDSNSKTENEPKPMDEVNSTAVSRKKRGKQKNNLTEVADVNEKSIPEKESEVDIALSLVKPDEVEESKIVLQNGTALSNNNIDSNEESKKPNKRGRKKKLDEKTAAENAKTEPETEKEEVVEKIPAKRGRRNQKLNAIKEDDSTATVNAVVNTNDVEDNEHVEDNKNLETVRRKKAAPIPKEQTVRATRRNISKEKEVKPNENIASKKKGNAAELLDDAIVQDSSNNDELEDIEANEPVDKKKKKNTAKTCPTTDVKNCTVVLKKNKSAENAVQEIISISHQKKIIKGKGKSAKPIEDQDNGESSKGKNKRAQLGSENDFEPTKPSKVPKKATKSSEPKNIAKTPSIEKLDFSSKSTNSDGKLWNFKISSWNINGVRAWLEKDGISYINHEKPDIIALQETKCSDDKLPEEVKKIDGYHCYWVAGDKDGYSGVGLLSKQEPIEVKFGIGIDLHDNEGRVITAEYEKFFVVAAYVPNAGRGLIRLDYRTQWDKDFLSYLKQLDEKKPVILCGDLNVAHEEIDLANPKTNKRNAGFTKEEREGFSTLLEGGFLDTFRHLYPDAEKAYTFWTYMMNARAKNVGWRLDYFVISKRFADCLCDSVIRKDIYGSDHCPITLFLAV